MGTKNSKEEKDLIDILQHDIYKDITLVEDLVKLLENIPPKRSDKHRDFCKAYTILLFQTYIEDENDREMMLAACGLLKGYEFREQKLSVRMTKYRKYAQGHNPWIKSTWADTTYAANCKKKLKEIGAQLVNVLSNKKTEKGYELGLLEKVPATLELPEPLYTSKAITCTEEDSKSITYRIILDKGIFEVNAPESTPPEKLYIIAKDFHQIVKDTWKTSCILVLFIVMLIWYINKCTNPNYVHEGDRIYNIHEEKDGGIWIEGEPQVLDYAKINKSVNDENKIDILDSEEDSKSLF